MEVGNDGVAILTISNPPVNILSAASEFLDQSYAYNYVKL